MATSVLKMSKLKIIKGQENVLIFPPLTSNKVEQTQAMPSHSKYGAVI